MNRIDRLFGILVLLQSRKHVPLDGITARFGISDRTAYRDIKALGELGIPLSFEPGRGYCMVQGYFLPPVSFTMEEANALLLLETVARGFTDKSIQAHYSDALAKVKAVLRTQQKERLEALSSQIKMQLPPTYRHDFEHLSVLQNAITSGRIIDMQYRNNNQETSRRRAEPLGLIFYAFNWHLVAWCHIREDYRDFRVSRILGIRDTGESFDKTRHIDLEDYMKKLPVNY